jgi:TatD DNase family protein
MSAVSAETSIVDTHLHLDDPVFDDDRDPVITAARAAGVRRFINIGYTPSRWEASRALRDAYPDVAIALGLHPQEADLFGPQLERDLRQAVRDLRPVAVGETGVDLFRTGPAVDQQTRAFQAQLEIAAEAELPAIIHQRAAAEALMATLDRWQGVAPIVLHSFDGTQRLADWAIERGCYIGVGGLATKRASGALREVLATVPLDRLLLETDSPYLSPPGTTSRRNTPANLPVIASLLAPLWRLTPDELCRLTTRNAIEVFGLSLPESVHHERP